MVASQLSPVGPGDVVGGRYRVERIIGIGGMGVVLAARHLHLDHLVAIKFLLPKLAEHRDIVGRFTREARAAVRIQNEHVARVSDVGTLEIGAPYMVMEYLDGTDLEDFLHKSGTLSIDDSVDFILQTCEAMAEAHGLGIIHRDLKPGNLFLVRRPDGSRIIKVLDFGISKVTDTAGANLVAPTSMMLGSPPYMSPEQLSRPGEVDARTDIWALGVILYRFLTGRLPFDAATIAQLCTMIMQGDPAPLRDTRPDVPPGLEWAILRCLEKDTARRYAHVGELARDLLAFAPDRSRISVERVLYLTASQPGTSAPPAMAATIPANNAIARSSSAPDASVGPAIETRSNFGKTSRRNLRSRRGALLLMGVALSSAGAFAVYRWSQPFRVADGAPSSTAQASNLAPPTPSPPSEAVSPVQAAPVQPVPSASMRAGSAEPPRTAETTPPPPAPSAAPLPRAATKPGSRTVRAPPARASSSRSSDEASGNWEEQRK
jgi:serine/threonine-protein kinase